MFSFANSTFPRDVPSSSARIGSTALHGPHHGAQKSSTTGTSAPRTSRSNVLSVTSNTPPDGTRGPPPGSWRSQPAGEGGEPEQRHAPDGFDDDRPAHLRAAPRAI